MITGHDFLGLGNKNFKVQPAIDAIRPGSGVGAFDIYFKERHKAFGDPYKKIRKLCLSGKVALVRIQIFWDYDHTPAPLATVKKAIPRWEKLSREFPNIQFFLSPSCEYKGASKKLIKQWLAAIRDLAPSCHPVLSPYKGAAVVPGVLVEVHGDKMSGALAVSNDGENLVDCDSANLIKNNAGAVYFLGWGMRYNLSQAPIKNAQGVIIKDNPIPPLRKAAPNFDYIKDIDAQFSPAVKGKLKGDELYKIAAEDKLDNNDPRANKPCLILPEKGDFAQILDSKGGEICRFPYYDNYFDEGWRYYSGSGPRIAAWKIREIAEARTGSSVIKARINGREWDIGSASHRSGYYQS